MPSQNPQQQGVAQNGFHSHSSSSSSSAGLGFGDVMAYSPNDRPISSATGIISLYDYGKGSDRRASDGSTDSDERARMTTFSGSYESRRVSRPLPVPPSAPVASNNRLAVATSSTSLASAGSASPFAPAALSSREPSPLPYPNLYTTPSQAPDRQASYFDPSLPGGGGGDHRAGSSSSNAPLWSPAGDSFPQSTSIDTPSPNRYVESSPNGAVRQHRPQRSLGGVGETRSDQDWYADNGNRGRSNPQLRSPSSSSLTQTQSRRRTPLPTVPQGSNWLTSDHSQPPSRSITPRIPEEATTPMPSSPAHFDPRSGAQLTPSHSMEGSLTVQAAAYNASKTHLEVDGGLDHSTLGTIGGHRTHSPRPYVADESRQLSQRSPATDRKSRQYPLPSRLNNRMSRAAYVNFALMSHLAVLLKESVPRQAQVKGSISYPSSFTGKDIVTALQTVIPRELAEAAAGVDPGSTDDEAKIRRVALLVAQSLKSQLFFHEVDWGDNEVLDGVEQVYMFLEDTMASQGGTQDSSYDEGLTDLSQADPSRRRDHPVASHGLDELPTGVFVPMTKCYSISCGRADAPGGTSCYSPSCPRSKKSGLKRGLTLTSAAGNANALAADTSTMPGAAGGVAHKAWAELVPKEVLDSLPKREVTRQNAILEHIQKEEDFLADLELLENLFIKGLEKPSPTGDPPPIPIGPDRDDFIREVFGNHRELVWHVRNFVEALHVRQREESPIVVSIGDLFLDAALQWQSAFIAYVANYPIAKSRIGRETQINPRFREFIESCRRDPACRRLGLDNFIHRALPHLQRHPLLLQTIIDKTEETNPDRESCIRSKEIIVEQCKTADTDIQAAQIKAKIRGFAYSLQQKRNKAVVDLDLLHPERQLIHEGRVYRKPDFTDLDWSEMQAILFDNYLVVTKTKQRQEEEASQQPVFVLAKRPSPVEMLEVTGYNDPSVTYSIGLNALHLRSDRESRDLWPFTIHHISGKIEPVTLYATSKQRRLEWRTKIEEAKGLRQAVVDANKAFTTVNLCDSMFALPPPMGFEPDRSAAGSSNDSSAFHGRVSCAVPFKMADQRRLLALGCSDGVWIGLRNDPSSFRKVLHLKLVTQCAVLEEFGIFVVLADKVLISYSLEALVPSSTGGAVQPRPPQKLSGNRGVLFFGVGVLKDRTLLVYMKKKANESVFKALEPVLNQGSHASGKAAGSSSGGGLFTKIKNDITKNTDWFRMFKVFFIPSEAYTMQFLRSKLAVVCARGFEIMNLDTLLPGTIPDFSRSPRDDPRILALARRVETSKPLGMFKFAEQGDFLLCYDNFACYVDRSGEPIRLDQVIEWEGTPQSVVYSAPYVIAIDHKFAEIREADTGRLVQVIRGNDLRYLSGSSVVEGSHAEHSIIFVSRQRLPKQSIDKQVVFELVQTSTQHHQRPPMSKMNSTLSNLGRGGQRAGALLSKPSLASVGESTSPHLHRQDTTATTSSGFLSYSGTMSSTRSGATSSNRQRSYCGSRGGTSMASTPSGGSYSRSRQASSGAGSGDGGTGDSSNAFFGTPGSSVNNGVYGRTHMARTPSTSESTLGNPPAPAGWL